MNKSRGQHEIYSFKIILDRCGKMNYFVFNKTIPFLFFRVIVILFVTINLSRLNKFIWNVVGD